MAPQNYQVSEPELVREQFGGILLRAKAEGRKPVVLKAAGFMLDELG